MGRHHPNEHDDRQWDAADLVSALDESGRHERQEESVAADD
ncbi:hypothetical protein [Actinocrispum sp. NPDC049592]